jgi:hypothetical protein
VIPMRTYYKMGDGSNQVRVINMSLWDAGNQFILCARNILQNSQRLYGPTTGVGVLFMNDTDPTFMVRCVMQVSFWFTRVFMITALLCMHVLIAS